MKPKFFKDQIAFRKWLEKNHDSKSELAVGFYKVASGKQSMTWPESVDQAICFGWIDGIRNSIDPDSYMIRFTPRKEKSHWSGVNLKKYETLKKKGLIHPSGEKAFAKMDVKNTRRASFEQGEIKLTKEFEAKILKNKKAWTFFNQLVPSIKRPSIWWVISAKREETKWKRLDILIKCCEAHEKIPTLKYSKKD